jgi:sorbitol-specific phosphotransferase system component IIA
MRHLVMRFNGLDWEVLTGEVLGLNADMPKLVAALSIAAIEW